MSSTLDLFDDAPPMGWADAYNSAFAMWLADANGLVGFRDSSAEVYGRMWSAWSAWAIGNRLKLEQITSADLHAYLLSRGGSEDLSARYTWRLLRLVDRVLASHARQHDLVANTAAAALIAARPELRFAHAASTDTPPDVLPAAEARRLVAFLSAVRPGRAPAAQPWQEVRDRSSVALMLGAGLTPGAVRALKVDDAVIEGGRSRDVPWKLRVAGNGNAVGRETPISQWAGQLLAFWLDVREEQRIPGPMMFPSTKSSGKPWSKMSQYLAAQKVLHSAGIEDVEGGSFRLRHTFAIRQLRRGKSPAEVARWLGVSDNDVMTRYQRVVTAPIDVI